MASNLIFLSHIHEEKALALIVKNALEEEFSGFVEVFVSSDGTSIPAGSNFLKRIEDGLTDCVCAIYLISPVSVKRNWINFELGAVWIRNVTSLKSGFQEIPTLPMCHSGATPSGLPAPLNNLNGIIANQSSQLEFAFRSVQAAVGGKGRLRTDFDALSTEVIAFERKYTLVDNIVKLFSLLVRGQKDRKNLIQRCQALPIDGKIAVDCDFVETSVIQKIQRLEEVELKGHLNVQTDYPGTQYGPSGAMNGAKVIFDVTAALVLEAKDLLLE